MTAESSFDADLVRLDRIRNGGGLTADCAFLLSFIDKLWKEYSRTLAERDQLESQGKWPCPMCSGEQQ